MSRAWIIVLTSALALSGLAVVLIAAPAFATVPTTAVTPTRLTVTAPASVGMGEDITIEVQLATGDGRPVKGAALTLFQVGAVGQRAMANTTTDEKGVASFLFQEFTLAHLSLRVAFAAEAQLGPSQADAEVEITGIEAPPAVTMAHTASPLVKVVLVSVLGSVWITYLFAGSCIFRIIHGAGDVKGGEAVRMRRLRTTADRE